jgi:hypothetical protein
MDTMTAEMELRWWRLAATRPGPVNHRDMSIAGIDAFFSSNVLSLLPTKLRPGSGAY